MDDLRYFVERERLAALRREAEEERLARRGRQRAPDGLERGSLLEPRLGTQPGRRQPVAPLLAAGPGEFEPLGDGKGCACAPGRHPA
jgi:hypothetical protein